MDVKFDKELTDIYIYICDIDKVKQTYFMSRKKSNIRNILHKKIDNHSNIEKSTMYFKKYCERNLEIKFTISCLNLVVLKKKKKKRQKIEGEV